MTRRVFIAGHNGMVGGAVLSEWQAQYPGDTLLTFDRRALDLTDQAAVMATFETARPDIVILAAAKVGGIHANAAYPADFIYDNIMIATNVIHAAYQTGVSQLLNLGSSCIYPRLAPQPMGEDALLTGPLEPTNAPYALAKIAAIKLCESYNRQHGTDFRSVMPTNLYGPGDNFHPQNSHVIPALLRRFHDATQQNQPSVTLWGSGAAKREFLHVSDMARACIYAVNVPKDRWQAATTPQVSHINIGTGQDISIKDLALIIAEVTRFQGTIDFDTSKPDGAPRKLLDVSKMSALGWDASMSLKSGLQSTYEWFLNAPSIRG